MAQIATTKTNSLTGISSQAKALIEKFEETLSNNLKEDKFVSEYNSIDDILIKKYKLNDLDNMDFPDFSKKTEFITKGVRGSISKAEGKILTYKEAEEIIEKGLNEEMP